MSDESAVSVTEIIHGLAREGRKAFKQRYSWTGGESHIHYLDGRAAALRTAAGNLAFEYANTDECDWWPKGSPRRREE